MFLEPNNNNGKIGWIEVICGSMFSGKTEELIRRLKRAKYANQKVEIFKPAVDKRYDEEKIISHDSREIDSTPVEHSNNIFLLAQDCEVVGIDEAQFFDGELPEVCEKLTLKGIRVIVAGLDMDYLGQPFGPMPELLARAQYITKVHAVCMVCGSVAHYTFRTVQNSNRVLLGEKDAYEARCKTCYVEGRESQKAIEKIAEKKANE